MPTPIVSTISSLSELDRAAWDALGDPDFPFSRYAFLRLLESGKSVGKDTGWMPRYVLAHQGDTLVGALPSYVKTDSYGEYVFDWGWAQAAARARIPYYPKILVGIPFTPANGPRFFLRRGADVQSTREALLSGVSALARESGAHGIHFLLCHKAEAKFLAERGFVHRLSSQFHFHNPGYKSYDDFLAALRSEPRKQLRRERRRVAEQGLRIEVRKGRELSPADWRDACALYLHTAGRKWGRPYLTEAFFERAESLDDLPLVVFASSADRHIAMSLSFVSGDALFGRYWGCFEDKDSLHFELCYHQLVEYAIAHGLRLVEAGAQGEHKFKRGFLPVLTHSAHWIENEGLFSAVREAMAAENASLERQLREALEHSPFRAG